MKKTQKPSVWNELWGSIKYCKESKQGKYSLDAYLDIIGEYADRQIRKAEEDGFIYLGGECQVINSFESESYNFEVNMFFENGNGDRVVKAANRSLPKTRFVSEANREIGEKKKFEIQRPD